jgi:hypothetical protein
MIYCELIDELRIYECKRLFVKKVGNMISVVIAIFRKIAECISTVFRQIGKMIYQVILMDNKRYDITCYDIRRSIWVKERLLKLIT